MQVLRNENVVFVDVDDTLVMHDLSINTHRPVDIVEIQDPIRARVIELRINKPMVRLLKEEKSRGSCIIVWSRGGYQWATNVVKALNLVEHVDQVMTKPLTYFDDKPVEEWLRYRVYLTPDTKYKE